MARGFPGVAGRVGGAGAEEALQEGDQGFALVFEPSEQRVAHGIAGHRQRPALTVMAGMAFCSSPHFFSSSA